MSFCNPLLTVFPQESCEGLEYCSHGFEKDFRPCKWQPKLFFPSERERTTKLKQVSLVCQKVKNQVLFLRTCKNFITE